MSPQQDLRRFLADRFSEAGGRMPFERFMQLALYDPGFGYYTKHIESVGGRRADFATSATLSPVLGRAIAAWLLEQKRSHDWEGDWHVIEIGGGDGSLALEVLKALSWGQRRRLVYHLVEISPVLESVQRKTLGRRARRVRWHRTIAEPIAAAGGRAMIFSNELVDAFPVRVLRCDAERAAADELWLEFDPRSGLRERFVATDEVVPHGLGDGQRFERHNSYRRWLQSWAPNWRSGSMLTIDYGDGDAGEIYGKRPMGTLRAYHRHQRREGAAIYQHFGKQDLTCDVNFGEIREWGEALGWQTMQWQTQADFFRAQLGAEDFSEDRATAFLLDSEGAGGAFKVLHQRAG